MKSFPSTIRTQIIAFLLAHIANTTTAFLPGGQGSPEMEALTRPPQQPDMNVLYRDLLSSKNQSDLFLPPWLKLIPQDDEETRLTREYHNAFCGRDSSDIPDYWYNNQIHTFGNTGIFGAFHALCAPLATKIIDRAAYDGVNIRSDISQMLHKRLKKRGAKVLDLCCGVGMSTRALQDAFVDADVVLGIDSSPEMIGMARGLTRAEFVTGKVQRVLFALWNYIQGHVGVNLPIGIPHTFSRSMTGDSAYIKNDVGEKVSRNNNQVVAQYAKGNAEHTVLPDQSFDLITVMFAFHEAPKFGRYKILREIRRLLKHGGSLAVVDISPEYNPSEPMLAGEPYVLNYQREIMDQMANVKGFSKKEYHSIVPGHVGIWLFERHVKPFSRVVSV